MTDDTGPAAMATRFRRIELLERLEIRFRGQPLRAYRFYLGVNDAGP
jgi:hypothetical protein